MSRSGVCLDHCQVFFTGRESEEPRMTGGLALPWQVVSLSTSSWQHLWQHRETPWTDTFPPPPCQCEGIRCQLGTLGQSTGVRPAWTRQEREMCTHIKAGPPSLTTSPWRGQHSCHRFLPVSPAPSQPHQAWRRLSWQPRQAPEPRDVCSPPQHPYANWMGKSASKWVHNSLYREEN